ncbi:hypothetical protein, partial [Hymenobacter agri]
GITPATLRAVVQGTGAREFHASAKKRLPDPPAAKATEFDAPRWETDAAIVQELVAQLQGLGREQT